MKEFMTSIVFLGIGLFLGVWINRRIAIQIINEKDKKINKLNKNFQIADKWLDRILDARFTATYMEKEGYKRVAIYGYGKLGKLLMKELSKSKNNIEVPFFIDQTGDFFYKEKNILTLEDDLSEVDAIIITVVDEFEEIRKELIKHVTCPILSLEDIINEK